VSSGFSSTKILTLDAINHGAKMLSVSAVKQVLTFVQYSLEQKYVLNSLFRYELQ